MAKFKPVSVKDLLRVGDVDDDELATALMSVLPRGAQFTFTTTEVEYRTAEDEWVLSLKYSKDGALVDALTGPAFTSTIEHQIRTELAEALKGTTRKVWLTPMFSLRRVEGWYKYGDAFLIRPAPGNAPRPEVEYAQHPWILEFSFVESSDFQVRNLLTQRRAYELALILNLLLGGQIDRQTNRWRNHWVLVPGEAGPSPAPTSSWCSEGYFIPSFEYLADDFSDTSTWRPLTGQPTDRYYGRRGFDFQPMAAPAAGDDLLAATDRLSAGQRGRFLRSCYWLHTADAVWDLSQSLHMISLINALECLAQSGEKRLVPDASTKMFLDFMEEYAPGRPSRTRIDKLYEVRSLVTHGERLLGYDTPQPIVLHPTSSADRDAADEAQMLARGAMINWLVRETGSPANLLNIDPYLPQRSAKPGTKSKVQIITAGEQQEAC
jgi:hypothetical protein